MDKLYRQLKYVKEKSHFYSEKFKQYPNWEKHFQDLPLTKKNDIVADQLKFPPFGSNICVDFGRISRIHKTSGTTGNPVLIVLTKKDIIKTVKTGAACFINSGLKHSDIVVHCLNYNLWSGGYTDHQSLEETGASVIPFGVGNSKNLIETILLIKPTAIHCTPSYLSKLQGIIKEEYNLSPNDLNIKLGLFGGESGLQNKGFRENIEKMWGFKAMNANYGLSEVMSVFGSESSEQDGLYFMGKNYLYAELFDIKTSEFIEIKKGAKGELILTNLEKESQPLIRYRTNDLIEVIREDDIQGKKGFQFEIIGRTDDMIVIKGVNLFLRSIEFLINRNLNVLTGVYQIYISEKDPIEKIIIKVEIKGKYNNKELSIIQNNFQNQFKEKFGIIPEVEIVKEKTIPRTDGKSKKIFRILN